jgi:hypothetical protein
METAAPWKPWKNELHVFPPFPPRLENSAKNNCAEFPTVPTAPTISFKKEENRILASDVSSDCMDKKESEA